jgi:hypothetical protein
MKLRGVLAALVMTMVVVGAPAAAEGSACATTWGSLPKGGIPLPGPPLFDIRAGRHECFDRLVIDVAGVVQRYRVEYVPGVTGLATGDPIAVRGGAFLSVIAGATDHNENYQPTYPRAGRTELVNVAGFSTFRQVRWAESQEGLTQVALGVRARLPFRVFVLTGPGAGSRLVIDVAHRW